MLRLFLDLKMCAISVENILRLFLVRKFYAYFFTKLFMHVSLQNFLRLFLVTIFYTCFFTNFLRLFLDFKIVRCFLQENVTPISLQENVTTTISHHIYALFP